MNQRFVSLPAGAVAASSAGVEQVCAGEAAVARDAALIGLDWGTTSLRAYLFDAQGDVLATRASGAGIMNLPSDGGFERAFADVCGTWLASAPALPVLAAGMVGSAQGWVEAPYVQAPAGVEALAANLARATTADGKSVAIVPGVLERGALPNVMRGEETQIAGALSRLRARDADARLIGLPGTHAKWALIDGERIASFYTFMTGEVYATLAAHTILGRSMREPATPDTAAFLRGVTVAREQAAAGMLATIFSTRSLGLTGQLAPEAQPDYLSGLLIGHELAGLEAMLARVDIPLADCAPPLIGSVALCERYRLALVEFGCTRANLLTGATADGLWMIATRAGLVAPHRPDTPTHTSSETTPTITETHDDCRLEPARAL
jgi:2-dehydro-3-deoxygalactonokinase